MAYNDRRRIARLFDPEQQLVSRRSQLLAGKQLSAGDKVSDKVPLGTRMKLWLSGRLDYEKDFRPTARTGPVPADTEKDASWLDRADGVEVIEGENGWYQIKAEWLDEVVSAHGEDKAKETAADLRAAPDYERAGLSIDHAGGGVYQISRNDEPIEDERVKGKDAAEARARELMGDDAGPPTPVSDIEVGSAVLIAQADHELDGREAEVEAIEGDQARLKIDGEGEDDDIEAVLPLASLSLASEGEDESDEAE